tara:strand:+ start:394 stop:648 length:255 start_codon:yes stop_codon:yes gene_type:complete
MSESTEQQALFEFGDDYDWRKEWIGMPEYRQENKEAIQSIVVHFETYEDMKQFGDLIGKNITQKTKGVFYPVVKPVKKIYVDES